MKTISEVIQAMFNGDYTQNDPCPTQEKFIENEDETIKENRLRKEKLKTEYDDLVKKWYDKKTALNNQFREDCIATEIDCGFNRAQLEIIWEQAYQEAHSCGMASVASCFEDLCDFWNTVAVAGVKNA